MVRLDERIREGWSPFGAHRCAEEALVCRGGVELFQKGSSGHLGEKPGSAQVLDGIRPGFGDFVLRIRYFLTGV